MLKENTGNAPVIHVCHAMLRAANDKDRNAQEDSQVLANLVGIAGVAVGCDKDTDVANDAQQEEAEQRRVHLGRHQLRGGDIDPCVHAANDGQPLYAGDQHAASQVAHPNGEHIQQIAGPVVKNVTDLTGVQEIPSGADGEQAQGKQNRAHHIPAGEGVL